MREGGKGKVDGRKKGDEGGKDEEWKYNCYKVKHIEIMKKRN